MTHPPILAFDIFGTVVDWHGSITREVAALCPQVDADAFALAWRSGYQPAMQRVRSGELGWTLIDDLHRMILDDLLPAFGLTNLTGRRSSTSTRSGTGSTPGPTRWPGSRA
jgi:2-haloacid dehalogenase